MKETIFEQVATAASVLKLDLSAEEFALFAEDQEFSETGVVAAGQNGNKQVGGALLARDRVLEGDGISSPVHLHGVPRLVLDAHGCRCNTCPTAVTFAKLGAHIWFLAGFLALRTVFFPQQRQGHA